MDDGDVHGEMEMEPEGVGSLSIYLAYLFIRSIKIDMKVVFFVYKIFNIINNAEQ